MTFARQIGIGILALGAIAAHASDARTLRPLRPLAHVGPFVPAYTGADRSKSGTWTPVTNPFPGSNGPDTAQLMTDGSVLMHDWCTANWYRLAPDSTGGYVNGTWSAIPPMPAGYTPLYFASEVLPDFHGRLLVNGGEYNTKCEGEWTNKGALYDPIANAWTSVPPPSGWSQIGDAQSAILPAKHYMLADCCSTQEAIAHIAGTSVTWKATGSGKADENDEEGWTLLPGGNVLTVDANRGLGQSYSLSELYSPKTGAWSFAGDTASNLVDAASHELGPAVLRPDGSVFYCGATGHTNIYTVSMGAWSAGPDFPMISGNQYDVADGPAALLPDGNVLVQASPGVFKSPSHFFEFDGAKLVRVNEPARAPNLSSYEGRMLELPSGQILWSGDQGDVEIYTPKGRPARTWRPKITFVPTLLFVGDTDYVVDGKRFNGLSQGAAYGDDAQMATNYPIVRLTDQSSGRVCYGRTHNFSKMGVALGGKSEAKFDVPATGCARGTSDLQVIVNGIASAPVSVTVM